MSTMMTREPTRNDMVQRRRARPRGLRGCAEPLGGRSRRLDAQRAFRSSNTKLSRVWLTLPPAAAALLALPVQKLNRSEAIAEVGVASESNCTRGKRPVFGRRQTRLIAQALSFMVPATSHGSQDHRDASLIKIEATSQVKAPTLVGKFSDLS